MEMAPRCSLATAFLCSALSTLLWVLSFPPTRAAYARSHHNLNERHAGERAESLPDGDGELLQGKTIDFGFTLRVPCVRRQSHRIRMQPWEEEERVCVVADGRGGGLRRDPLRERTDGWAWVCQRAMSSGQKMQLPFFRVSRGSWLGAARAGLARGDPRAGLGPSPRAFCRRARAQYSSYYNT